MPLISLAAKVELVSRVALIGPDYVVPVELEIVRPRFHVYMFSREIQAFAHFVGKIMSILLPFENHHRDAVLALGPVLGFPLELGKVFGDIGYDVISPCFAEVLGNAYHVLLFLIRHFVPFEINFSKY